jgi:hypothetical protein
MVQVWRQLLRLTAIPEWLRRAKELGYTKGSWTWIIGTDRVEVRAWKVKKK